MAAGNNSTLGEQAYQALKNKIMTLESGTYMSARQFATEIGMSYTPVREAFLRLQREGYVKQIPNVGFFVETMKFSDLIQFYQVRECLEPFVLNKVFSRFTPQHLAQMKEYIEMQRAALMEGEIMEYIALDVKVHEVMFDLYGNHYLAEFYHNIRSQYMICSDYVARAGNPVAVRDHEMIVKAIEEGRKEDAHTLLCDHISESKFRIKQGYMNIGD